MIRHIEELSANAWPALQTMLYDGWVLRFANGYTKRANSIIPLYPSVIDTLEKIQTCEQLYRSRNLDVVFKMTGAVYPEGLDAVLEKRGYQVNSPTSVQVMQLESLTGQHNNITEITDGCTDNWLSAFRRLGRIDKTREETIQKMLSNPVPQKGFFSIQKNGHVVACGLGVVQNDCIGLFDIITDASFRNQGYGRQMMIDLLSWGKQQGARTAYLQVMLNNAPALNLYTSIGFMEIYQYWYRIGLSSSKLPRRLRHGFA